jgi:hypothetical protein
MLKVTVQELGDASVSRCQGRIVIGDADSTFCNAVLSQTHARMLVLDLAQVAASMRVAWGCCWTCGRGLVPAQSYSS